MQKYIYKHNFVSFVLNSSDNCGTYIPTNDFDAFDYYVNYNNLYNKYYLSTTQNIICGIDTPNLSEPQKIIVRPIKNLFGMSKNCKCVNYVPSSKNNFTIPQDNFWCIYLNGNHLSVDVFKNKYGIKTITFMGKSNPDFTFDYWEYHNEYKLPNSIVYWIDKYLNEYNGVFNLEIIGDKIIECHMRMGDLNWFQSEKLIQCVIDCHMNKSFILPTLPKIFLVPIFVDSTYNVKLRDEDIWYIARKTNTKKYILHFTIDSFGTHVGNPIGKVRICNLSVSDLQHGFKFRKYLIENINNYL